MKLWTKNIVVITGRHFGKCGDNTIPLFEFNIMT